MSGHATIRTYLRIFVLLAVLTLVELAVPPVGHGLGLWKSVTVTLLGVLAAWKASYVGLYYMHLKYETKLLWGVIGLPLFLVLVMVIGFLPDALH